MISDVRVGVGVVGFVGEGIEVAISVGVSVNVGEGATVAALVVVVGAGVGELHAAKDNARIIEAIRCSVFITDILP